MTDLGPQFKDHPNLRNYQSGGIGHRPDDPSRSVVGMVPTHILAQYRHHEGDVNPDSHEVVEKIRGDLRSGHGLENPVMLEYDHKEQWASLGEGNHRLRAHELEGRPEVPVRVVRSKQTGNKNWLGVGGPATHNPIPGIRDLDRDSYVPSDIHPSYLNLGAQFHG
jgi:hypothetical protein